MCVGHGHLIVYANEAFVIAFGHGVIGRPVREVAVGLPTRAFDLLDAVLSEGRPFSTWLDREGEAWRMTAVPRRDPETHEVYGVTFHLRARSDLPVVAATPGEARPG